MKYGKTIVILLHLQQAYMYTFESTFEFRAGETDLKYKYEFKEVEFK